MDQQGAGRIRRAADARRQPTWPPPEGAPGDSAFPGPTGPLPGRVRNHGTGGSFGSQAGGSFGGPPGGSFGGQPPGGSPGGSFSDWHAPGEPLADPAAADTADIY